MPKNTWIAEVIEDLEDFARINGRFELASALREVSVIHQRELSAVAQDGETEEEILTAALGMRLIN